jgi:hypothetical protein
LAEAPDLAKQELKIEILDGGGKIIRTLKSDKDKGVEGGGGNASFALPAEKGINRISWDLRRDPTVSIDYEFIFGAASDDKEIEGYTVAPGRYGVRLSYGDVVQESTVDVSWDPITDYDEQAVRDQQQFVDRIFSMLDGIYRRVNSLQKIRQQIELRKTLAADAGDEAMVAAAEELLAALKEWQESVTTPHRGNGQDVLNFAPKLDAFLTGLLQQADAAVLGVTQGQRDRFADLEPEWAAAMQSWNSLIEGKVAEFTRQAGPAVVVPGWE